jgi:hypothetical protein
MSKFAEVTNQLWLHTTFENDPCTVDRAFAAIRDNGEFAIDGLIWALHQDDVNLKLLALQLFQEHYADATRALPAVRFCIRGEDRLVRVTAINTCGVMNDTSEELIPLLTHKLESEDDFERIVAAGSLLRISCSEDAYIVLTREAAAGNDKPTAVMSREYLKATQ